MLQENNRLIDLLSRIDLEKSHLQQALTTLQSTPPATSSPPPPGLSQSATIPAIRRSGSIQPGIGSDVGGLPKAAISGIMEANPAASGDALQQLRADLVAEQARRKQAEQDFQVSLDAGQTNWKKWMRGR